MGLLTAIAGGILELTLDAPERKNSLSLDMLRQLAEVLAGHRDTTGIGAVIISGTGETFSSGANLDDLDGTLNDLGFDRAMEAVTDAIASFPLPVIAAVEGPCMGAAFDLAMSCDVRIAGTSAFFEVPATRLGILYNPSALLRLERSVRPDTLARLFLVGERILAGEAQAAGLVSILAARGESLERARTLGRRAAANSREAVAATKALFRAAATGGVDLTHAEEIRRKLLSSTERQQAIARARRRGPGTSGEG